MEQKYTTKTIAGSPIQTDSQTVAAVRPPVSLNTRLREDDGTIAPLSTRPQITLIIPAYNEEQRLPRYLSQCLEYLNGRGRPYEILVIDDGSSDGTAGLVQTFAKTHPQVELVSIKPNQGKGNAVRSGALRAQGDYILFADADGSTPIMELERLKNIIDGGARVAIGSRALDSKDTNVDARWYRKLPGRIFAFSVNTILGLNLADTQCGFKMFTHDAAKFLFGRQQSKRFDFDMELLYVAKRAGILVREVAVNWAHVKGSKVSVLSDGLKMFLSNFKIWWRHRGVTPKDFEATAGEARTKQL